MSARIEAARAEDHLARRSATTPGAGAPTASALAVTTPEVDAFKTGESCRAIPARRTRPLQTGGETVRRDA